MLQWVRSLNLIHWPLRSTDLPEQDQPSSISGDSLFKMNHFTRKLSH
jgi:hypothetical protein